MRLYHGDCVEVLRTLPDRSVDTCVTSPPYWALRDYGAPGQIGLEPTPGEFVDRMAGLFREVRRVLADHGTVWLNLGDTYASDVKGSGGMGKSTLGAASGGNGISPEGIDRSQERQQIEPRRFHHGLKAKDLVGIPWRVAFALQDDGWYLRSDIIWHKPNPMPESIKDRPTKSHEYIFLLAKQERYYYDATAVKQPHESVRWGGRHHKDNPSEKYRGGSEQKNIASAARVREDRPEWDHYPEGGKNLRSVWKIPTRPYPGAHFATFPEELPRLCILAGAPERVCIECGRPSERILEEKETGDWRAGNRDRDMVEGMSRNSLGGQKAYDAYESPQTIGWTDCGHNQWRPGMVLDPFAGSATTLLVARNLQRHAIGIELNTEYLQLAAERLQQLSLLT